MFDAGRSGRPSLEHGAHGSRARRCTVKGGFRLNKYKKLMSNTIIFSIGTFSSKLLVFLLMPLYTRVLSPSDYGTVDIITQTASLLMPVVSLSIASGIIRFGLDKRIDKSDVFSIGLVTILAGFGVFFLFSPLLKKITFISQYTLLIYLYVFMALIKQLCAEFVRSKQYVKLYAFDGILATVLTIILNVLFWWCSSGASPVMSWPPSWPIHCVPCFCSPSPGCTGTSSWATGAPACGAR